MEIKDYLNYADECIMGGKPPCTCACPFNLDLRKLLGFVQNRQFSQAYKLYRDTVAFPGIVCRVCPQYCGEKCVREIVDEAVRIKDIECACVDYAEDREPPRFGIPKRNRTVAVIGASMAGLTCGMRLASRGYDVTVYEKENRPGGRVFDLLDEETVLSEIGLQMRASRCRVEYNREITSFEEVPADAVVIASGMGGVGSELREGMNIKSFGTACDGYFLIGGATGADIVREIAQGGIAAISVDKYIKIGKMDGMETSFPQTESCIEKDVSFVEKTAAVTPAGDCYTEDEAAVEAGRCLKCDCDDCKEGCELFDHFSKSPKTIIGEAVSSVHVGNFITKQTTTRLVSSCTLCGLCGSNCPKDIDIGKAAHDFRVFRMRRGSYPEGFSDFFVRDMNFSNGEAFLARLAPNSERARYMFFPGCGLGGSDPRYVTESYKYLLGVCTDTAIYLGCCGAPADWGAREELNDEIVEKVRSAWESFGEPVIITACATCMRQLATFLPEAELKSLYEIMAEYGVTTLDSAGRETMSVFDPCASRERPDMQKSVRALSDKTGTKIEELHFANKKARCCGWGGHVISANRKFAETIIENRISESTYPYITYCTNCRDTFALRGKECVHILDLVFGLNGKNFTPPTPGEKRINRLKAKNTVLADVFGENVEKTMEGKCALKLKISLEMKTKLSKLFILEEEVCETVKYLEETKNSVYNGASDTYIGYLLIGIITYWVEYRRIGEGEYELVNAYTHRVKIDEGAIKG